MAQELGIRMKRKLVITFISLFVTTLSWSQTCDISGVTSSMICAGKTVNSVSGTAACMSASTVTDVDLTDKVSQVVQIVAADTGGITAGTVTLTGTDAAHFRLDPIKFVSRKGNDLSYIAKDGEPAIFSVVKIGNLSSSLSAKLKYTEGSAATKEIALSADPANTALKLWLNVSTLSFSDLGNAGDDVDSSGTLTNGDRIANWADLTGNATLVNTTDNQKPKYITGAISTDTPALHFDGSNDILVTAGNIAGVDFDISDKFTIFLVAHGGGTDNSNGGYAVGTLDGTDWRGWSIRFLPYTAQSQIMLRDSWADWCQRAFEDGDQDGGYSIITATFSGTNTTNTNASGLGYYLDGENRGTNNGNVGSMTTSVGGHSFSVGALANNARPFKGYISEVIVFSDELSSADRQHYECYLAGKYGVTRGINNSCP